MSGLLGEVSHRHPLGGLPQSCIPSLEEWDGSRVSNPLFSVLALDRHRLWADSLEG
jgi:hypothetical protein